MTSEEKLRRTLRPIMAVSMVLGMTFPRPISQSWARVIFTYRIFVVSGLVLFLINEMPTMNYWTGNSEGIQAMLAFLETRLRWLAVIINFVLSGIANPKINSIICKLGALPIELKNSDHNRIIRYQFFAMITSLVFLIPYMVLGLDFLWLNPYYRWYTSSVYILTEFYIAFSNLQFVVLLYVIRNYVTVLNGAISRLSEAPASNIKRDGWVFFVGNPFKSDTIDEIIAHRRSHMILFESYLKTNECFSLQVLLFLLVSIIELTYAFRSAVMYLINPNSTHVNFWRSKFWTEASLTFFWSTYYFWHILNILAKCEGLVNETKYTVTAINVAINKAENREVEKQLQVFTLQLANHPVSLTAGKFVDLSFPLVNSIIGTVTTYLIIITTLS